MSIFDRLKNVAEKTAKDAARSVGNTIGTKRETFTFSALPESLAEMQALPEAKLDTPFATAALTVLALCAYAADRSTGTEMLNWLRGRARSTVRIFLFLMTGSATERLISRSPILQAQLRTTTILRHNLTKLQSKAIMFRLRNRGI